MSGNDPENRYTSGVGKAFFLQAGLKILSCAAGPVKYQKTHIRWHNKLSDNEMDNKWAHNAVRLPNLLCGEFAHNKN